MLKFKIKQIRKNKSLLKLKIKKRRKLNSRLRELTVNKNHNSKSNP